MRKLIFFIIGVFILTIVGLMITGAQVQKEGTLNQKTTDAIISLPTSLDNFFPPVAEQPVFLFRMLGMNKPFTGIVVDFFENDLENAFTNYEKFLFQYVEISKMIPEWEAYFPLKPVNELETALKTGDREKIITAFEQVGKVCSNCHRQNMPKVQQKYFWGDFHGIRITDPLTHQEVDNQQLMLYIDASFTGIEVDLEQGQVVNARRHFQDFWARFQTMEETCMNCHDTERHYYVDKEVKVMIDRLGQALNESPVDPKEVAMLHQGIGMESCFKCHLVHVPPALAQIQMGK